MQTSSPSAPFDHNYALFLDVDGTLVDFREDPADVWLPECLLSTLSGLRDKLQGALVLLSGRAIWDLDRMIGERALCCVGLHGLSHNAHCAIPQETWTDASTHLAAVEPLRAACLDFARQHPDVLLEDKHLGVALHYRRDPQLAAVVQEFTRLYQQRHGAGSGFELLEGKMVMEFRPIGVNKGTAIESLLTQPPFQSRDPVFIGDDVTDEQGFAAVNSANGVSIKCGEGDTCARYRLEDVAAVQRWLTQYLDFLAEG